jgi:transcriptional regulator with XRE-family HTH domain
VGAALRALRRQRHLSLADVATRSHNEFKASSLGAYERGDRTISVDRLRRLANLYGVRVETLLHGETDTIDLVERDVSVRGGIVLELSSLRTSAEPRAAAIMRFANGIKSVRSEPAFSVLVVRRSDAAMVAALLDCDPANIDRELQVLQHQRREPEPAAGWRAP